VGRFAPLCHPEGRRAGTRRRLGLMAPPTPYPATVTPAPAGIMSHAPHAPVETEAHGRSAKLAATTKHPGRPTPRALSAATPRRRPPAGRPKTIPDILLIHSPRAAFTAGPTRLAMTASTCAQETGSDGNGRAQNRSTAKADPSWPLPGGAGKKAEARRRKRR
jgi:hypothetical protein